MKRLITGSLILEKKLTINKIMETQIKQILEKIGEDSQRKGLLETPKRVARMYKEIFKGYDLSKKPKITIFPNNEDGIKYDQIVIDKGYFYSQCEHHMVPFFGEYSFGYIPDKTIVGISKISRLVDWYSSKLQVQERLTQEVAEDLQELLQPLGIMLVMKGRHLCKEMRGTKKYNSPMITSYTTGAFRDKIEAREEFLKLIQL